MSDIRQIVKEKLAEISNKAKEVEALENELSMYGSVEVELQEGFKLQHIKNTTDRKNLQGIIRAAVVAKYDAMLAEIDSGPAAAMQHLDISLLSDADRATLKRMYKDGLQAQIDAGKQEISDSTGLSL